MARGRLISGYEEYVRRNNSDRKIVSGEPVVKLGNGAGPLMDSCPYCSRVLSLDNPLCDCETHCVECCPFLDSPDGAP